MKNIIYMLVFITFGVVIGCCFSNKNEVIYLKSYQDTITIRDTLTEYYPEPYEVQKAYFDTLYLTDTIFKVLPFEVKRYKTDAYDIQISGYKANLDNITVYPTTTYITTQTSLEKPSKWHISHGVQGGIGYGLFSNKLDVWIGYGLQIEF